MVGLTRLELVTSRLSGVRSNQLSYRPIYGGDEEIRTPDPLLARQVLSQLSYTPTDAGHPLSRLPLFVFSIFIYIQLRRSTMPSGNGLKWTRTTDLTLIRRAL